MQSTLRASVNQTDAMRACVFSFTNGLIQGETKTNLTSRYVLDKYMGFCILNM